MWSRRRFLSTVAAGVAVPAGVRAWPEPQDEIKTALNGPVGLQMWSLREYLPKDLAGTLKKVRAMGFRDVEGAGLWKHTAGELRAALDSAGLRCQSAHVQFERLRDDAPGAFAEAKALGARWVVCPWIPHDKVFTRDDALKSAEVFNKSATAAEAAGLRFAYHCHGYEMLPSPEGTRFDTLAQNTDPARVMFQVDVFHALHGGGNPGRPHHPLRRPCHQPAPEGSEEGCGHHERHRHGHAGRRRAARHRPGGLARRPPRSDESGCVALLPRRRERRPLGTHSAEPRIPQEPETLSSPTFALRAAAGKPRLSRHAVRLMSESAMTIGDRSVVLACNGIAGSTV